MAEVLSVNNWRYDVAQTNGVAGGWKLYSYGSGPSLADISLAYPDNSGANFDYGGVSEIGLAYPEGVLSVDWSVSATATANLNVQTTGPATTITGLGARVSRRLGTGCSLLDGGQVALTGEFLNVSALVGAETPVFPLPAHIDYMGESYWFDDISLDVSCPPGCSVWLDPVSASGAAQLSGADPAGKVWVLSETVAFLTAAPSEWAWAQVTDSGAWDLSAVATRGTSFSVEGRPSGVIAIVAGREGRPSGSISAIVRHAGCPAGAISAIVGRSGRPAGAISAIVHREGRPAGVISAIVGWSGRPAGALIWSRRPSDTSQAWAFTLLIDGVDYSARLTGSGRVEAEEGGARIAEIRLSPGDTSENPAGWVGRVATLDVRRIDPAGSGLPSARLFTGVVDGPHHEVDTGTTLLHCTDDLRNVVGRASKAQIDAVVGGLYSYPLSGGNPILGHFYSAPEGWAYAQDRAGTVRGSLDLDAYRSPRMTPWSTRASADLAYGVDDINDGSLSVDIARRETVKNVVRISFTWRHPRCKVRALAVHYDYPFDDPQVFYNGYDVPTRAAVSQALAGTGWTVGTPINWVAAPAGTFTLLLPGGGSGYLARSQAVADQLCWGFSASLFRRYVQWVDDLRFIKVWSEESVLAIGESAETASGSVAVIFDASAWEANPKMQPIIDNPSSGERWVDYGGSLAGLSATDINNIVAHNLDASRLYATDAAGAQLAQSVLVARAKRTIAGSHRYNTVSWETGFDTRVDVTLTASVAVATSHVSAQGKIRSFTHAWDFDSMVFSTRIQIALSEMYGAGVDPMISAPIPVASPLPPTGPFSVTAATHVGNAVNTPNGGPTVRAWQTEDTRPGVGVATWGLFTNINNPSATDYRASAPRFTAQFTVQTPEIEAASRDNLRLVTPITLAVNVPQDLLTIVP
jgi:hypothetical protein